MKKIILFAQCSLILSGCSLTGPDRSRLDELRENRARWEARQPPTYEYVLQRLCECVPEATTPMRITVHEGQVSLVVNTQTEEPIDVESERVRTIEELFLMLEDALPTAYRVTAEYDEDLGYPTTIYIDSERDMVDEETSFNVRELRAVD